MNEYIWKTHAQFSKDPKKKGFEGTQLEHAKPRHDIISIIFILLFEVI